MADFLLVGDNQHRIRWWHPLSWLVAPTAYLVWYVAGDLHVYDALDPARQGPFAGQVLALAAVLLTGGYAIYASATRQRRAAVAG